MRLSQNLIRARDLFGSRIGTVFASRQRTWGEIADRVARFASALQTRGVGKGDRVMIAALNSDRYLEAQFAVAWAGAISVPANTRWAPAEMAAAAADSTPRLILADQAFLQTAASLPGMTPARIICMDDATPLPSIVAMDELIAASAPMADACGGGDVVAGIFYTSGTTGAPKGVMLTHGSLVANFLAYESIAPFPSACAYLHAAPMFHMADATQTLGLTMLGAKHVMISAFTPQAVIRSIQHDGVNTTLLVPTMIGMVLQHLESNPADLSALQDLRYGASPISEPVLKATMRAFPNARIQQAYGQTELSPIATVLTHADHLAGGKLLRSAGRAIPDVEVQVWNGDLKQVAPGEVGEIVVRSKGAMMGYWNQPDATAQTLIGGWLRTGDAGYLDEDRYLFLVDRLKDMIISGGENVYSAEVEKVLANHPAVLENVVIGVPDATWGERIHAIIRLREGAQVDADELLSFCRELIAAYKCPRSYEFRAEPFPLSGSGKIQKAEIRKTYWGDSDRAIA